MITTETGVVPETKEIQEAAKIGIWRCPICTYDNEDDMSACEICGVLRNPLVKGHNKSSSGPGKHLLKYSVSFSIYFLTCMQCYL